MLFIFDILTFAEFRISLLNTARSDVMLVIKEGIKNISNVDEILLQYNFCLNLVFNLVQSIKI